MIITQHVSHAYGFRDMRSLARREPQNELVRKLKNFARNEKELDPAMRVFCWQTQMRTVMITRHEMFETSNIGCSA
jgi:hypothetical protein